ncbi:MAG: FGGY family carbohydrate kinase [Devosia sp.]
MPVLGIDIGTQSLKAVVLDDSMRLLGAASQSYPYLRPRPGWAEQRPGDWLAALRPAIADALAAARLQPGDIDALSCCGQLDGAIAVDRSGGALGPAIIWMDRRAMAEADAVDADLIATRSGLVCDSTHMAAKIAWLKRNGPSGAALYHQPVSFVLAQLTGEAAISPSLASTTMLYGLAGSDWDDVLLDTFGIKRTDLPRLVGEAETAGRLTARGAELTGLPIGTPVATGTGDDFSNPLGCGVTAPGVVAVSLGTAETVAALSSTLSTDAERLVETHLYPGGLYHLGNPGWLSGGAMRWAAALLAQPSDEALVALAAEAPPGCEGLVFLPALTGAMAPRWNAVARGSFIGLSASHGPAHLARAVLEGTAFAMRDVIDRLMVLGVPTDRLRLMGGGARSALWCQIRADLTCRSAEIQLEADASAIGAGLLAAVAAGIAPDMGAAAASLDQEFSIVAPNAALAGIYDASYRSYRAAYDALDPYWDTATGL